MQSTSEHNENVLSTLRADGSRRWLRPRLAPGRFHTARRIVGWILIAIFVLIPYFKINGKPLILLDVSTRHFTFFGFTFLPTDTLLLALFMVGLIVTIFLVTALLGRIWCGWMCPQLVYLEFVYRPIEYWLEGKPGPKSSQGKKATAGRVVLKYGIYFFISFLLAHVFLAYFVSVDRLWAWMHESPLMHPLSFAVVLFVTGLMMFDFCYFREQTCILACPYGRLQSVMLDRDSLIISYDEARGEPRGRMTRDTVAPRGDCIDCNMCVDVCPTGIDIREGLQLECVACAQCIDACDTVMEKISKPLGLIRYSSQNRLQENIARIVRPRVIIYPLVLVVLMGAFFFTLSGKGTFDASILRGQGRPFFEREPGRYANQSRLRITNRTDNDATYSLEVVGNSPAELVMQESSIAVPARESLLMPLLIEAPREAFENGRHDIEVIVRDHEGNTRKIAYRLLGARGSSNASPPEENSDDS